MTAGAGASLGFAGTFRLVAVQDGARHDIVLKVRELLARVLGMVASDSPALNFSFIVDLSLPGFGCPLNAVIGPASPARSRRAARRWR